MLVQATTISAFFAIMLIITIIGVVKHLLQGIRNQAWRNEQYEKYILGGKEYKKKKGLESSFRFSLV